MFQVYHSNQLSLLKDLLVALMQQSPLEHPFDNETVLVQSPGMAQWLQLEIAASTGIAANIDFPLPASFIWQQFIHVLQDVPDSSPFNKMSMTWHIMQLLPECLQDPDFSALQHYLEADDECRKRFQLSQKIADIFDQYLVYRPEWIDRWDEIDVDTIAHWQEDSPEAMPSWINDQRWQAKLWKKLSDKIERNFAEQGTAYHRAGLYKAFLSQLAEAKQLHHLPARIFVFGISALPESYLQALLGLSEHCDVHFLLSNPCRYYWADIVDPKLLAKRFAQNRQKLMVKQGKIATLEDSSWQKDAAHRDWALSEDEQSEVGNPLLASMGKMGRDFLFQLYSLEQNEIDAFVDIERDTMLHHIQADILALEDHSQALSLDASQRTIVEAQDQSLSIHLSHSVMREVEVLHDNLLAMFSEDAQLTPKDIIVMVPNIDQYAPYVQAVFSNQTLHNGQRYIPYSISDLSAQHESPILVSFLQLLKLNQSRYTREDILALLEVPAILARFNLSQQEFVLLQKWIDESGIRWGLNEHSATQWDLPKLSQNSWLFGLKRMLLGYAMGDDLFAGISPYDDVQGLQGDLLGRFIDFIDTLLSLEKGLQGGYDAAQWQQFIYQLIDDFYLEDDDNTALFSLIRDQLDNLLSGTQEAQFDEPISLYVLLEFLENHLANQSNSQRFLAGQVNFCTLMPMRSIPFKVVCLLGMNDGDYPRNIVPMGFDLMAGHRKRGDRSFREESKYLFLEALISAQDKLYISYIGRDISDNSEKMTSVLVSELLNYCQQTFALAENHLDDSSQAAKALLAAISHAYPMQSFSESYYHGELSTYNNMWWQALTKVEGLASLQADQLSALPLAEPLQEIQLLHLKQFLRHPCKTFFNRRLDIYFELDDSQQDNDEPFELDGLQTYQLKGQQFTQALAGKSLARLFDEIQATGELPAAEFATLLFERDKQAMEGLADRCASYFAKPQAALSVDIDLTPLRVVGELADNYAGGLLRFKTGTLRGKEMLALWVDHLCYCIASPAALNSTFLGQESGVYFEAFDASLAQDYLQALVSLYEQGLQSPLAFFIDSAHAWCEQVHAFEGDCRTPEELKESTRVAARTAALSKFDNERSFSEGKDPYISRAYDSLEGHWAAFEAIALQVFKPILNNINVIEYSAGKAS